MGSSNTGVEQVLSIIAEEVGMSRDEMVEDTEFAELGIDRVLARVIVCRVAETAGLHLPTSIFDDCCNVRNLIEYVSTLQPVPRKQEVVVNGAAKRGANGGATSLAKKPPLAVLLQGSPATARKIVFLLPDGSGSGMAYVRVPHLAPDVCLYGLNSPHLGIRGPFGCTLEAMAREWAAAIRAIQPYGPYVLGGWSAGGYYSFEVARLLMAAGEAIERMVLIDSPCRLDFEAMPMEVVSYLSAHNLMGNWGPGKTPDWLVHHFDSTLAAVRDYMPTPMPRGAVPLISLIWASDSVFHGNESIQSGLDLNVKVTRLLLDARPDPTPLGWDRLFPGAEIRIASSTGNHFTMVHPPYSDMLGSLLREAIDEPTTSRWAVRYV